MGFPVISCVIDLEFNMIIDSNGRTQSSKETASLMLLDQPLKMYENCLNFCNALQMIFGQTERIFLLVKKSLRISLLL